MGKRNIVVIDEDKCNGCGLCVSACTEGAIQLVDGKAKLVSDTYCDGLGACLGECPQDPVTIEQREAVDFNEKAAKEHMAQMQETEHAPDKSRRLAVVQAQTPKRLIVQTKTASVRPASPSRRL